MRFGIARWMAAAVAAGMRSRPEAQGQVGPERLCEILALWVVAGVRGQGHAVGALRFLPAGGGCVVGVHGRVRGLVEQDLLEDAVAHVVGALGRVDQQVLVAAAERKVACVNPHRAEVAEEERGQAAHRGRVEARLGLGLLRR
jgi:hypothetical protein